MTHPSIKAALPTTVLIDRRGVAWRAHALFQDQLPGAPGWLLMASERGEALEYSQVVQIHGYPPDERCDRTYLIGFIE